MPEKTILLVEDDASLRRVLAHHLTEAGYRVLAAADGKSGLDLFTEERVEMVITDIRMPEMSGLDLLRRIKVMNPETVVLVITAYESIETAVEAMKLGAHDYITKPFDREKLLLTVAKGLEYAALACENRMLRQFIGSHFPLNDLSFKDAPENPTAATVAAANVLIKQRDDGIDLEEVEREIRSG